MAQPKTKPTEQDVVKYLESIEDPQRRSDSLAMDRIMREISGELPQMWVPSLVGYGRYHYRYDSGREGDWMATGFSPRKNALTLYIMSGFSNYDALMENLGKYKTGKSCLYVKKLEDVHLPTLKKLIAQSLKHIRERYPESAGKPADG